ncbi:MAG TPA: hypothetical protein VD966_12970 [Pyrinomonadaceae bacterium]|nr:hypothetical protein [Pyrinomonadaceae bacterium]
MIADLNLASHPFRNRTLPWTITSIITVASLLALVLILRASIQTNAQAAVVENDLRNLRQQADQLKVQVEQVKSALAPDQLQTLQAAHTLVDRKRFSWSRLFADLEAALPGNVRVTRISVRDVAARAGQTFAELELTVVGKNPGDVTSMIAEMDRLGVFQAEPLAQNLQRGRGESGTEWTLYIRYTPRAGAPRAANSNNNIAAATNAPAASNGGQQ